MIVASLIEIYNAIRGSRVTFRTITPQHIANDDIYVGNNAVVCRCVLPDSSHIALKCYASRRRNAHTIYGDSYIERELCLPTLAGRGYVDVTTLPWIEGTTLESYIKKPNTDYRTLSDSFDLMALEMLRSPWAHGDIKPDNVIITPSGDMKLIDFDAMWIPGFTDADAEEIGTPAFSHPLRDDRHFDKHIDDFSIAMLSTMLAALALKREYFEPHITPDSSLFDPQSVIDGSDTLFTEAMLLFERRDPSHYAIAHTLYGSTGVIDGLDSVFEQAVNSHKNRIVVAKR